eukprot:2102671-Alexandrium_andersonii.AAC.1
MSASLVGSEMCIRDRVSVSEMMPKPVALRIDVLRGVHLDGSKRLPMSGPVSYTHLTLPTICSV